MSWLATCFIYELIEVGNVTDLGELHAFKIVSLQMVYQTFCHIFYKKLHHIQVFDDRYEWPKRKRKQYLFTPST